MYLRFFIAILVLLSGGCVSQSDQPNNNIFSDMENTDIKSKNETINSPTKNISKQSHTVAIPPSWYTNSTPEYDKNTILGYGEGLSTDNAIDNALGNITQQLETTVSAYSQIQTNLSSENGFSKDMSEKVTSYSKNIVISDYKLLNKEQLQNRYYVLIEIDKPQSIKHLKKSINDKNIELQSIKQSSSSLNNFKTAEYMSNELLYLKNAITTLYLLDDTINLQPYLAIYHSYAKKLNLFKENIKIYVDSTDDGYLLKTFRKYLRLKYKLTADKYDSNIQVAVHNSDFDESGSPRGDYKISTKVTIQAQDTYTKIISKAEYDIRAESSKGRQATIDKACEMFNAQLIKSDDIFSQG